MQGALRHKPRRFVWKSVFGHTRKGVFGVHWHPQRTAFAAPAATGAAAASLSELSAAADASG